MRHHRQHASRAIQEFRDVAHFSWREFELQLPTGRGDKTEQKAEGGAGGGGQHETSVHSKHRHAAIWESVVAPTRRFEGKI